MVAGLSTGWRFSPTPARTLFEDGLCVRSLIPLNLHELAEGGLGHYFAGMNTLAEVEAVVPSLSAEELAKLERLVRDARLTKTKGVGRSALDLPPLNLGRMLKPLGSRVEWYDEMLEGRV